MLQENLEKQVVNVLRDNNIDWDKIPRHKAIGQIRLRFRLDEKTIKELLKELEKKRVLEQSKHSICLNFNKLDLETQS